MLDIIGWSLFARTMLTLVNHIARSNWSKVLIYYGTLVLGSMKDLWNLLA